MNMTKDRYNETIPKCCEFKTFDEHWDYLGLCWGVTVAMEKNTKVQCGNCQCNTERIKI